MNHFASVGKDVENRLKSKVLGRGMYMINQVRFEDQIIIAEKCTVLIQTLYASFVNMAHGGSATISLDAPICI